MAVRILTIFPVAHRKRAKVRARQMAPWIARRALPKMFAGAPGKSADDGAWMLASLPGACGSSRERGVGCCVRHLEVLRSKR
eukprot:6613483-Alexandrium_andersonii.AAC.1